MNKELENKVALVTGASRGLGRAIALRLAERGAKVAVNYTASDESADAVAKAIRQNGGTAMTVKADIGDAKAVKDMVRRITSEWGKLDILVNNAGITRDNLLAMMNETAWDEVLNTNLRGAFLCTRQAARSMTANTWGRIINIASLAGVVGNPGQANYSAAKGGLIAFTRSVARELGPLNITANAIAPGFIVTDMTDQLPEEHRQAILERIPLKRFGDPDDVAEIVAFLASERASYITAQVVGVDGGVI